MQVAWNGVIPAITTPFDDDMEIDLDLMARHARWLVDAGCVGIVPFGSLGEGATVSYAEKLRAVERLAAELDGKPTFFIVESDTKGLVVEADPSMGLRAAGLGRLILNDVAVPESAILGDGDADQRKSEYADAIRLARLGWASLAAGTSQAVLD